MGAPGADKRASGLAKRVAPLIALILLAGLGAAASLIADWPGHFEPDSVWQLAQGRTGVFNAWHPPIMAFLLGLADRVLPGARFYLIVEATLFFGALVVFAALQRRLSPWVFGLLALIAASPLALIYQGLVVKDVLFADLCLAAFALIAALDRVRPGSAARWAMVGAALGLLTLAALARQNGAIAAGMGLLALGAIRLERERSVLRAGLSVGAAAAAMAAAFAFAGWWLEAHGDHRPEAARELNAMQVYDLAGAVSRDPDLPLPILSRQAPDLEDFIRDQAAEAYDPARMDPLRDVDGADTYLFGPSKAAGAQWRALITASPMTYLAVRAEVFRWVFMTPDIDECAPILIGVDADDQLQLRQAGLRLRVDAKDNWDSRYAEAFLNTPVFSHPFYAVLDLILLALALRDLARRRDSQSVAIAAMLTSALLFTLSFFPVAVACDYRYLYFLDVAAMAGLLHRLSVWTCGSKLAGGRSVRRPGRPARPDQGLSAQGRS